MVAIHGFRHPSNVKEEEGEVEVTQQVYDTITEIRDEGQTNMLDYKAVQYHADKKGCFRTVCWIQDDPDRYARSVSQGFKVKE